MVEAVIACGGGCNAVGDRVCRASCRAARTRLFRRRFALTSCSAAPTWAFALCALRATTHDLRPSVSPSTCSSPPGRELPSQGEGLMPLRLPPKRCMQLQGMDTRRIADGGDSVLRADRRPVGWDEGWPVERSPRENLRIRRRQLAAGPRLLDEVTLCAWRVNGVGSDFSA